MESSRDVAFGGGKAGEVGGFVRGHVERGDGAGPDAVVTAPEERAGGGEAPDGVAQRLGGQVGGAEPLRRTGEVAAAVEADAVADDEAGALCWGGVGGGGEREVGEPAGRGCGRHGGGAAAVAGGDERHAAERVVPGGRVVFPERVDERDGHTGGGVEDREQAFACGGAVVQRAFAVDDDDLRGAEGGERGGVARPVGAGGDAAGDGEARVFQPGGEEAHDPCAAVVVAGRGVVEDDGGGHGAVLIPLPCQGKEAGQRAGAGAGEGGEGGGPCPGGAVRAAGSVSHAVTACARAGASGVRIAAPAASRRA